MKNITSLMFYLAFGLLVYLLAYGSVDWSDEWVYVIVMLWPFALLWWGLFYVLCFVIAVILMAVAVLTWGSLMDRIR